MKVPTHSILGPITEPDPETVAAAKRVVEKYAPGDAEIYAMLGFDDD